MMTDTATAGVQYVYRCQHPDCTNRVSVAPHCPWHGGWSQLHAAMHAFPIFRVSAELAGARNEFTERPVKA